MQELGDEGHLGAAQAEHGALIGGGEVNHPGGGGQADLAAIGSVGPPNAAQHGGLAATRRPSERKDRARHEVQVEPGERMQHTPGDVDGE